MKLETLALKWAITRKKTKLSAVEQKWTTALAPFDFDIKYRPGRCNGNADGLSRLHDAEYDANTILADTRATSVVPLELRVAAMELVANADHLDETAITTLPGISNADMIKLQRNDAENGRLRYYRNLGRQRTKQEKTAESANAIKMMRYSGDASLTGMTSNIGA